MVRLTTRMILLRMIHGPADQLHLGTEKCKLQGTTPVRSDDSDQYFNETLQVILEHVESLIWQTFGRKVAKCPIPFRLLTICFWFLSHSNVDALFFLFLVYMDLFSSLLKAMNRSKK